MGDDLVDQFLQIVNRLDMGSRDKAVFAGNSITLHDLRQSSQDVRDFLELSGNRLMRSQAAIGRPKAFGLIVRV